MTAKPFTFVLDCSRLSSSASMFRDLSVTVLGYVGCADDTALATADALQRAVAEAARAGTDVFGLTFHSTAGAIDIILSSGEREVWRASRVIS